MNPDNPYKIIETHAHYDDPRYDGDRDSLLPALHEWGVEAIVNVGADMASSRAAAALAARYNFLYAAAGIHPHEAKGMTGADLDELAELSRRPKVIALGEMGLDFHYDLSPRDVQKECFQTQLELAEKLGLPVIIHSREANGETMAMLRASSVRRGVIHCFSGTAELALAYAEMGFFIGIGGVITFDKSGRLERAVQALPLERVLLETDCPYLSPAPHRGRRNDSSMLTFIAEKIASAKDQPVSKIYEITRENAKNCFPLLK